MLTEHPDPTDQQWFRRVLGQFPTGVTSVTAMLPNGEPVGMVVGSFTSVSLNPPMVAFFPGKSSTTWPKIEASGSFCVSVLSSDQEPVCRALASKSDDKFADIAWTSTPRTRSPYVRGSVAWIDCTIESVVDGGDHWIVLGRVVDLDIGAAPSPLLFFRGGYGRFATGSRLATEIDMGVQLHALNRVRPAMERLAAEHGCECVAAGLVDDEIVLLASAGSAPGWDLPSRVGERVPAVAPFGRCLMAWAEPDAVDRWTAPLTAVGQAEARTVLDAIQSRGYSVTVEYEPATRPLAKGSHRELRSVLDPGRELLDGDSEWSLITSVAVPVLDRCEEPIIGLALYGLQPGTSQADAQVLADELHAVSRAAC